MQFVKVRNSARITKVIVLLVNLIFINSWVTGQVVPQQQPLPTQLPANLPSNIPTNPNDTRVKNRIPVPNDQANARNVEITAADEAAITHEDSVAMVMEQREAEDLAITALRRRIFGYKFFSQSNIDPNSAINIATPNNYIVGANDQLIIDIYGYSQDHIEVTINPDGFITLPRAGIVKLGGLDIGEATKKIKTALGRIYSGLGSNTFLNVSLGNVRTIKVNIIGEVIAPGTYTLTSFSTILNALYSCGGPNEIGTFRDIKLIRNNEVIASLDLYDIITNGSSKDNRLLQDQDIIQVSPIISRVAVNGLLKRNGLFEIEKDETLSNTIAYAGGFDKDAYKHRIKVYRNTNREKRILDVHNEDFERTPIVDGDSIVVERVLDRFENLVTIEGAVFRGGEFSLTSSPSLMTLINAAEGLREDALTGRIRIVRTNEDLSLENFSINLKDIKSGFAEDFQLKRQDQIIVPSIFDLTETAFVRISGAINNPDAVEGVELPFMKNMTLEDVLVQVGGLTEAASLTRFEISRRKRNVDPSEINAQIADIITLELDPSFNVAKQTSNMVLQPFDEVFVRTSPNYRVQTFVDIQGEVLFPASYGIATKEERVSDIIKRAGGPTLQAYVEGATLIRTVELSDIELDIKRRALDDIATAGVNTIVEVDEIEPTQQQSIGIDLKRILQNPGGVEDITIQDGDIIKIPKILETIRVQGEVLYPNTVKFIKSKGFKDYISGAGGFTKKSLRGRSYVLYANGSVDRTRKFLVFNVFPKVKPGSEIIVPMKGANGTEQLNRFSNVLSTVSGTLGTVVTIIGIIQLTKP